MVSSCSEEMAYEVHAESPPIDLHADPLLWARFVGYNLNKRHRAPLPGSLLGGHVDVPRMVEGGLGAQFFGLVSLPFMDFDAAEQCHRQIDLLEQASRNSLGRLRLTRSAEDIISAQKDGVVGALTGIEGAHNLNADIKKIESFARRGVRYLGLLHFSANPCGAPSMGSGADPAAGLTVFGHEVIEACEAHGVLVDLAHINRRGFMQGCGQSKKPVIVSHTGVAGIHDLWRNIDDDQIRAVAKIGGIIGIIFVPAYLGKNGVEAVVDHIEHLVRVGGENVAALGSDWDGFVKPTRGLETPAKLRDLTKALARRGFSRTALQKILRDNALRVLRDVPPRWTF